MTVSNKNLKGWIAVTPDAQRTLFPLPMHDALRELGITLHELKAWQARGWLSQGLLESTTLDLPEWNELSIIRDLERSELGQPTIDYFLQRLPRPLAIDPKRLAFSFSYGWVMRPEPQPHAAELEPSVVEDWVESVPDEELDVLWQIHACIVARLRRGISGS